MLLNLKKFWELFTPTERRRTLWMLLLVVLMAAAETLSVLSILPFLSVLSRPDAIHSSTWMSALYARYGFDSTPGFIMALGLASITVVLVTSAFKTVTQHTLNRFVHLQRHTLSSRLLSRYLRQPYEFFLDRNPSLLAKNALSEVDRMASELTQPLSQVVAQGAVVLAMTLLILIYDPWTALCMVGVLGLLYGTIYWMVRRRLERIGHERHQANGQRYQACNEVLGGIKDVKVTQSADAYLKKFNQASRQLSRHVAAKETLSQAPLYLVEAIAYTGLIAIALILLMRSNDVAHVLPALGLYGFASYRMLPAAQIIYRGIARLKFSSSSLDVIHRDLMLPDEPPSAQGAMPPLRSEISLRAVRYAYPSAPDKTVLDDLDLTIPANTSIGIVGKSGAGKSTLMDILLGLLQPQSGSLSVDGTIIGADNVAAWQRSIGYVPQHIYLADASVAENIAFGVAPEIIDMRAVEHAARIAQIDDFVVRELPQGYETRVGDRGIRLSGGQRQRIGIARALYRDPAVLLMDEATSALDTQTEEAFNAAIKELSGQKTIVVIAHRQASLRSCQRIISLNKQS